MPNTKTFKYSKHDLSNINQDILKTKRKCSYSTLNMCNNKLEFDYNCNICDDCLQKYNYENIKIRNSIRQNNETIVRDLRFGEIERKNTDLICIECKKQMNIDKFIQNSNTCQECFESRDHKLLNDEDQKDGLKQKCQMIRQQKCNLMDEQIEMIIRCPCNLCGFDNLKQNQKFNNVDRFDIKKEQKEEQEYDIGNVFTICRICQMMRRNITIDNFYEYCSNIYNRPSLYDIDGCYFCNGKNSNATRPYYCNGKSYCICSICDMMLTNSKLSKDKFLCIINRIINNDKINNQIFISKIQK